MKRNTRIALATLFAAVLTLSCGGLAIGAPLAGDVTMKMVPSKLAHRDRRVWVYTPPGYAAGRDTCGLLVAFDGADYVEGMGVPAMLDSLIAAHAIGPTVAVFVDDSTRSSRLDDLANRAWFVRFLAEELIPWTRAHWRVTRDPHRVVITGSSAGGLAAVFAGLRRPDVFGNVFSQSGAFWRGAEASNDAPWEWLASQVGHWPRGDVRLRLEVGSTEVHGALGGAAPSILEANRRMRDSLRAHGYAVEYTEIEGGVHAPQTWGPRLPAGIAASAAPRTSANAPSK